MTQFQTEKYFSWTHFHDGEIVVHNSPTPKFSFWPTVSGRGACLQYFWVGWIPRNLNFRSWSLNCYFSGKITKMKNRSWNFKKSSYIWFNIFNKNSNHGKKHFQKNRQNHMREVLWNAPKSMWKIYFEIPQNQRISFSVLFVLKLITCLFLKYPIFPIWF